jgi:hypothetical protein
VFLPLVFLIFGAVARLLTFVFQQARAFLRFVLTR